MQTTTSCGARALGALLLGALGAAAAAWSSGCDGSKTRPEGAPSLVRPVGGGNLGGSAGGEPRLMHVVSIRIRDRTLSSEPVPRIPAAEVQQAIVAALRPAPGLRWAGTESSDTRRPLSARDRFRLEADLELQGITGSDKGKASVLLTVALRPTGKEPDALAYEASSLREQVYAIRDATDRSTRYRGLLREAVVDALGQIASHWRLRHAPAQGVARAIATGRLGGGGRGGDGLSQWLPLVLPAQIGMLGDLGMPGLGALERMGWAAAPGRRQGASVRAMAIRVAAVRRLREAVPALVRALGEEAGGPIRDLCLGALAEIRDPAAVPAILKFLRGDPEGRLRKVIAVLGQIGGPEAEAFLEMTADGDADEDVRELARQSLESLRQRRARARARAGRHSPRRHTSR